MSPHEGTYLNGQENRQQTNLREERERGEEGGRRGERRRKRGRERKEREVRGAGERAEREGGRGREGEAVSCLLLQCKKIADTGVTSGNPNTGVLFLSRLVCLPPGPKWKCRQPGNGAPKWKCCQTVEMSSDSGNVVSQVMVHQSGNVVRQWKCRQTV